MKNELKKDLSKLIRSVGLYISLAIGTVICILNSVSFYKLHKIPNIKGASGYHYPDVLILGWLGGNVNASYIDWFMFIMPMIAVLPYGWSLYVEQRKQQRNRMSAHKNKVQKIISKYVAAFLSGGFVCAFPFLLSWLISAWYLPDMPMEPAMMQSFISNTDMLNGIYYSKPWLYMLFYILLIFVFGGLFSTMALNVSGFSGNVGLVMIYPIVLAAFAKAVISGTDYAGWLPEFFLNPCQSINISEPAIVVELFLLLLWDIVMISVFAGKKYSTNGEA